MPTCVALLVDDIRRYHPKANFRPPWRHIDEITNEIGKSNVVLRQTKAHNMNSGKSRNVEKDETLKHSFCIISDYLLITLCRFNEFLKQKLLHRTIARHFFSVRNFHSRWNDDCHKNSSQRTEPRKSNYHYLSYWKNMAKKFWHRTYLGGRCSSWANGWFFNNSHVMFVKSMLLLASSELSHIIKSSLGDESPKSDMQWSWVFIFRSNCIANFSFICTNSHHDMQMFVFFDRILFWFACCASVTLRQINEFVKK